MKPDAKGVAVDDLITRLDRLNRKERFFLIAAATTGEPRFRLHESFRSALEAATSVDVPADAYAWMDYHLDWLYAALELRGRDWEGVFPSPGFPPAKKGNPPLNVNANQEDIDLLVAFRDGRTVQLFLVEAKGVTRFGNTQLASKTRRLRHIFGADGKNYPGVEPWFVLASPERPKVHSDAYRQGLRLDEIPDWMLFKGDFAHIELLVSDDRLLVERCDKDGRPDRDGKFWQPKRGPLLSSVRVGREGA